MKQLARFAIRLCAAGILVTCPVAAHKLATHSTPEERKLAGISSGFFADIERRVAQWSLYAFTEPVHEEITNRIYGCDADICAGSEAAAAPAPVLAGVRWNDDPPFRMSSSQARDTKCKVTETIRFETQPGCWVTLFMDANKGAAGGKKYGPGDAMLYRTHFGDLQFLHAMASRDGEIAGDTKKHIMGWFEFTWRTSLGEYTLDTRLREIDNPTIQFAFGHSEWRLLDLFTQGASGGLRRRLDDVAFGSLLHTLQDSYAEGHAAREESSGSRQCVGSGITVTAPGAIVEFHAYNHQDHSAHADADSRAAFVRRMQEPGDVVEMGRALVQARDRKLPWSEVEPVFDCLLTLQRPEAPAGPGDFVKAP
jgi:hypothetical protein